MYGSFEVFRQQVKDEGFEQTLRIYYSIYRALVKDNADPEERGRILISCPSVGHDSQQALSGRWVDPAFDAAGPGMGWFNPPLVGSAVRVMFDNGNPGEPKCYFGGWFTTPDGTYPLGAEFSYVDGKPQKRGFRSRVGHALVFDDAAGEEAVTLLWRKIPTGHKAATDPDAAVTGPPATGDKFAQIQLTAAGITITDSNGTTIYLNTADKELLIQNAGGQMFTMIGKTLNMSDAASPASCISLTGTGDIQITASKNLVLNAANINIEGGGIYLSKGAGFAPAIADLLLPWLSTHTHTCAAPGAPSTPPVAPPPPSIKAQSVKLK